MSKTTKSSAAAKPLPMADILRDLAVLRSSEADVLGSLIAPASAAASSLADESLASSYDFAKTARSAIKLHDSAKTETQGARIEDVRGRLENLLEVLDTKS
ncbi:hypothetical protein CPB83DRAFT_853001 [Crepidotus variabilis]|uniref:Uncharacterized protein n=1 Tax=Crepidotus variabilis TaxID=179855 RepID=A0A9P6JR07_9AGAR|nr:hypothetical protein CPB83DRAFT_853001 [Crepidotus variabilis]